MAVFKCKMCGGTLDISEGMTVCECEYCGSTQTVPQLDDEKKINLFTRANRLRLACEFDKAFGVYESIVSEFSEEAEAYWGLILCKYGIEYVDDPATGKKIPTCHRSSFDSVMDDPNFEMVMEYSDAVSRRVYRDEAKQIEELRKGIIEVSAKEEPYDIFICYKETDENGSRTIDSVIAQDVYDALTEKGYKVFFSRITLEDKLGQEYEPYIFAALNSAKVMLVFGTDYEYYNAVWVKNEWSRFLALIAKGEKKTLIPCYKNIDAYDMPKEFHHLQAQDMGKVGAIQDLLRGIGKIIGTKTHSTSVHTGSVNNQSESMKQRGYMALEDGEFEEAKRFFERALDINPSDARAYLGKFLAQYGFASLADFDNKVIYQPENNKLFKRAEQFADPALGDELRSFKKTNEIKIERLRLLDALKKRLKKMKLETKEAEIKETTYLEACELQESGKETKLAEAATIFSKLNGYKDSAKKATACMLAYEETKSVREERERKEQEEREARERKEQEEREAHEKKEKEEQEKRLAEAKAKIAPYRGLVLATDNKPMTYGLKEDGTVAVSGMWIYDQYNVSGWSDIVAISASKKTAVGLKAKGNVVAAGDNTALNSAVSGWRNIVEIAPEEHFILGIKSDGTVAATGKNDDGQCNVSFWKDIKAVAVGYAHSIGLKSDGTVVATGSNQNGKTDVSGWKNIIAVATDNTHTVGLKSDGTVVSTKYTGSYFYQGQCEVSDWSNIVEVAAKNDRTVGLKADGTVVAVGDNKDGQCDVQKWSNIVAIALSNHVTLGLKEDGTVVAAGQYNIYNDKQRKVEKLWPKVSRWNNIVAISVSDIHAVGLKSNGKVVVDGEYNGSHCNVDEWKLFKSEEEKEAEYTAACRLQASGKADKLRQAADAFKNMNNYKDSAERAKACMAPILNDEKTVLEIELANLKGIFSGKRRKEINARLAQIEDELKKL